MSKSDLTDAQKKIKSLVNTVDKEIDVYRDTAIRYCGEYAYLVARAWNFIDMEFM